MTGSFPKSLAASSHDRVTAATQTILRNSHQPIGSRKNDGAKNSGDRISAGQITPRTPESCFLFGIRMESYQAFQVPRRLSASRRDANCTVCLFQNIQCAAATTVPHA